MANELVLADMALAVLRLRTVSRELDRNDPEDQTYKTIQILLKEMQRIARDY